MAKYSAIAWVAWADADRLRDTLDAIDRADKYLSRGREAFFEDAMSLGAFASATARYPAVRWRDITDMRNVLAHEYFALDLEEIWSIAEREIPLMRAQIQGVLEDLGEAR